MRICGARTATPCACRDLAREATLASGVCSRPTRTRITVRASRPGGTVGLAVYGLITYLNANVAEAFALGEAGRKRSEILTIFR